MMFGGKHEMRLLQTIQIGIMPEYSWWQILLINLVWIAFFLLIQWLMSLI